MGIKYSAILPDKAKFESQGKTALTNLLKDFGVTAQKKLQTYPAAQPWKNPPKTGPRRGGKRTGSYGRGWAGSMKVSGYTSVELTNNVTYAVYVGGPTSGGGQHQTRVMSARGWPNVTQVGQEAAAEAIGRFSFSGGKINL